MSGKYRRAGGGANASGSDMADEGVGAYESGSGMAGEGAVWRERE